MKALIIALLLTASTAYASGDIATTPNKAGGLIKFTDVECSTGKGMIVHSALPDGKTFFGCYNFYSDVLMVTWNNGDVYSYHVSTITLTDYYTANYGKSKTTY